MIYRWSTHFLDIRLHSYLVVIGIIRDSNLRDLTISLSLRKIQVTVSTVSVCVMILDLSMTSLGY